MASAVYQRMTGPTYPVRFKGELGGAHVSGKLLRTQTIGDDLPVTVQRAGRRARSTGVVVWRRFPTQDAWQEIPLRREGDTLVAALPAQAKMASKIEYHVRLDGGGQDAAGAGAARRPSRASRARSRCRCCWCTSW